MAATSTRTPIVDRLARGDHLLLDGANATELKRRGIIDNRTADGAVTIGIAKNSAVSVLKAPNRLRGIHEDYLTAGADIFTTNTFNTSRWQLVKRGVPHLRDRMEEITRKAALLTIDARDRTNPGAYVVGSVSVPNPGLCLTT